MNYYHAIKDEFVNNIITKKVNNYNINKSDLSTYYNVGKLLVEAQGGEERAKYGNKLIKEYSNKLTKELGKGYSETNLKYMRQFYLVGISPHFADQLPWGIIRELLFLEEKQRNYYIKIFLSKKMSRNDLRKLIKSKEYERLPNDTKLKIDNKEEISLPDTIKNPILIKNLYNLDMENISEKALQKLIVTNIYSFLKELGDGYTFVGNEYKIKIGNNYNYIDLLLFNIKYNCYVVVELKVREFRKEDIGQIKLYMIYIDEEVKEEFNNNTQGIIICKENDELILKYIKEDNIIIRSFKLECVL